MNKLNLLPTPMAVDIGKWSNALSRAKDDVVNIMKTVFDVFLVPIFLILILVLMAFEVFKWGQARRDGHGDDMKKHGGALLALIVSFVLIAGYSAFAWGLL